VDSSVTARRLDSVLLVQLRSPDDYPRLTRAVLRTLSDLFRAMARRDDVCGIVLTGSETAFAAGADLEEVAALDAVEATRFAPLGQGVMRQIENLRKPVVAAIRGYCLGGGFDLAMACHLRYATPDAVFGHPGGALGLITGWGGTARLPRIVGRSRALELLTSGRTISAQEAFEWKLVNRVVEPTRLLEAACAAARGCM